MDFNYEKILINIQKSLKGKQLNLSNEKLLQMDIEESFKSYGLDFKREVFLDKNNIVDFMISELAIEVKIHGKASAMSIYRQLERYSKIDKVGAILLLTSKTMSLPLEINNKPVYILSLGRIQL